MIIHTFVQLRDSIYETNALPYREQPIESGIFRRSALSKNTKKNASVDAKPFNGQFAWTRRTAPTLPSQISSGKTPMISGETSSTSSLARSSCRSHYCAASSALLSLRETCQAQSKRLWLVRWLLILPWRHFFCNLIGKASACSTM